MPTESYDAQLHKQVLRANDTFARVIVESWPLPRPEARGLARVVRQAASDANLALDAGHRHPVSLDRNGCFLVGFRAARGLPQSPGAAATFASIVRRNGGKYWLVGVGRDFTVKSTRPCELLKGAVKPSNAFLRRHALSGGALDPVVAACLAAAEELE